jgi:hypothetical protein
MSSWLPNDYSHRAQLASVMPGDIKTFAQLLADVHYADLGGDSTTHGTGRGEDSGNDKKQLAMRAFNLCADWLKKHPGASKDDFEKTLAAGALKSGENGGLSSDQQKDLFAICNADASAAGSTSGA